MFQITKRIPFWLLFAAVTITSVAFSRIWVLKNAAAVSADNAQNGYIFVLDAGHGGEDGGASSLDGTSESGINLAVTLKLDDLSHLLGLKTVLIRSEDTAVYSPGCTTFSEKKVSDLHNRVKIVNSTTQAFLVSIHQNYFPQSQYSGAQVFYNQIDPAASVAERLQQKLTTALDSSNNRKAKSAEDTIFLMREITKPGILVECGFLSNPAEAEKLKTESYQKKLALVIASALYESAPKEIQENEI